MTIRDLPGVDAEAALGRLRGNEKLYTKLIVRFAGGAELEALRASVAAGDAETATRDAHTVKGAAANLSAESIRQKALELETALKTAGAVLPAHAALVEEMAALYGELKAAADALE